MKHFYTFTFLFFTLLSSYSQVQNYSVGDVVDDFTVTDIEGNTHNLYEYTAAGKYVYIDFFFTTCGPCQATAPKLNEFYDKFGCGAGDIMCMSINQGNDDDAAVTDYDETYGGEFNHAPIISMDGGSLAVRSNFGITYYPTICLINPENEIINLDIWPVDDAGTFETVFPEGFNPEPMACTVGVNDEVIVDFSVFPNPTNGESITLVFSNADEAKVEIIDILGKVVFKTLATKTISNLNIDLNSGNYFIKVETDKGVGVHKLIVQ